MSFDLLLSIVVHREDKLLVQPARINFHSTNSQTALDFVTLYLIIGVLLELLETNVQKLFAHLQD